DLAVESGDGSCVDDHATLAVGERLQGLHGGGGEPQHVEGADQVDADDLFIILERHRAVAADDALGRTDAGAIDQDARGAVHGAGGVDRRLRALRAGDIAGHGDAFDVGGDIGGAFFVEIEN